LANEASLLTVLAVALGHRNNHCKRGLNHRHVVRRDAARHADVRLVVDRDGISIMPLGGVLLWSVGFSCRSAVPFVAELVTAFFFVVALRFVPVDSRLIANSGEYLTPASRRA